MLQHKAKRLNPKAADIAARKVLGKPASEAFSFMKGMFPDTPFRMYKIEGRAPRYVALMRLPSKQMLFEITRTSQGEFTIGDAKNELTPVGTFSLGFNHREITDPTLRGRGLGSKALRIDMAHARKGGFSVNHGVTQRKSTALLYLKNGFRVDVKASAEALNAFGVRTQAELLAYLNNPSTPERVGKRLIFDKPLHKRKIETL